MLSKRFSTIDRFSSSDKSKSYNLLPFRFTAIDEYENYFLSNDVGEHTTLDKATLSRFINKGLDGESPAYKDLQAKHFLQDSDSSVALDLLALKYRTKSKVYANFTGLHIFVVTLRCDYSCPYCQVSRQSEDKDAFDMNQEDASKALKLVFQSPSPQIKIEFQGGESLLNFELIKAIVEEALIINQAEKRDLQFVIATNLTPLNDEILNFCYEYDIHLSTSLDGPENVHDKNRPRKGKNGYSITIAGIQKAQSYLGQDKVSALMTTTETSLKNVKPIIDEYLRLRLDGIFLRPISPYGFAVKTKQAEKYDVRKWLDFYKDGLDYIIEINKKGVFFPEHYTALILKKMYSSLPTGYVDLQSPSGIGIGAVVYNYDGKVYASDEARMLAEMGDDVFCLGNVDDDYESIFTADSLLTALEESLAESSPQCNECAFLPYCGSDPTYHYATQKDFTGHKALSGFCEKNMAIFKHIINKVNDDPAAKRIMLGWIN